MKRVVWIGFIAFLGAIFAMGVQAEKTQDTKTPIPSRVHICRRKCDVNLQDCIKKDVVSDATCNGTRDICYGICADVNRTPSTSE